jgi:glycosyltransferase involved in cell wall biosynthesis
MRIGIASTHMWSESAFRNAGISKSSYRVIDALSANFPADKITVFANSAFELSDQWKARTNLTVHSTVPIGRGRRALWESFGSAREVQRGDFDIWMSTTHAVPVYSKIPTVAIIHDMIPLIFPEFQDRSQTAYLQFALVHVAKRADLILTNSEQTKSDIVRFSKVSPNKVVVVPFGPGADLAPVPRREVAVDGLADVPYRRFFFLLGTLEPRKNLSRFFEAFAMLKEPAYRDVGLAIGGGRGWREEGIFSTLESLGIRDRVTFLGYVLDERLPELFAASEGFVFPSLYEGFGMPLVEAMQLGSLVLSSHLGAMREVVEDAAIPFDPMSPSDMANALRRALELTCEERATYVRKGFEQSAQFNWTRSAQKIHQALEGALANR